MIVPTTAKGPRLEWSKLPAHLITEQKTLINWPAGVTSPGINSWKSVTHSEVLKLARKLDHDATGVTAPKDQVQFIVWEPGEINSTINIHISHIILS